MTDSKEVIDAIVSNDLDKARDATKSLLYQKAADLMSSKKEDIASQYTMSVDVDDVHTYVDVPSEVESEVESGVESEIESETETETPEPEEPTDATDHGND